MSRASKQYYDSLGGEEYERQHPPKVSFIRYLQRVVRPGDRVLEVGCGTGYNLAPFGEEHLVAGIDPSAGRHGPRADPTDARPATRRGREYDTCWWHNSHPKRCIRNARLRFK